MGFEDFLCNYKYYFKNLYLGFILSEEDKTTKRSIEYWFKVVDLDENGIIT